MSMKIGDTGSTTRRRDHDALGLIQADLAELVGGKLLITVKEAAQALGLHPNSIRKAIYAGSLTVNRRSPNGPIRIRIRELARWILDGERLSLPRAGGGER